MNTNLEWSTYHRPGRIQAKEWYRVDPNPGCVGWSGRANINMQESAILITMNTVAHNKEKFLENYYVKNKQMIEQGRSQAPYAYVIPAKQRRQVEAADFMNPGDPPRRRGGRRRDAGLPARAASRS